MQLRPPGTRPSTPARLLAAATSAALALVVTLPAHAATTAEIPAMPTRWTDQVGPDNALPDYPRPQLTRPRWQNLNGPWEYAGADSAPSEPDQRILVPYPPESELSGVRRHDEHMLYRRGFDVPADWRGDRLLLHFGAVDQRAEVRVNGRTVATHEGGYTGFSADVTDALKPGTHQELTVSASDANDAAPHPIGKQRNDPGGIYYTGASGIWQTVWLEPVPDRHITNLDVTPDPGAGAFALTTHTNRAAGQHVEAVVREPGGREISRTTGSPDARLRLPVPDARLWTPDDPFLYDLSVRLVDDSGAPVDEVGSYAGMRSVGLVRDDQGRPRLALNGKILFQHGPLDQGYWPDGIYTAPTDEALRFDLEQTKRLGFNMVRKHAKVEPARWYAWADRLGLLVWQDMPSLVKGQTPDEPAKQHYESELDEMLAQLHHFPSIVTWVPFNEGWGEFDTRRIAERIASRDPSRLVDPASGVNCCDSLPDSGAGHIYDDHTYVGPGAPKIADGRATADGEYGGLGLVEDGHVWPGEPSAYEMTHSREELTRRYGEVHDDLRRVIADTGLSASVYTQTTDVENEINGLFTYDRSILKPDADAVAAHNRAVIDAGTP